MDLYYKAEMEIGKQRGPGREVVFEFNIGTIRGGEKLGGR
jgi:hypothetical protein